MNSAVVTPSTTKKQPMAPSHLLKRASSPRSASTSTPADCVTVISHSPRTGSGQQHEGEEDPVPARNG